MTRYVLNSAVIAAGGFGRYEYVPLRVADVGPWLKAGPFESRVGYPQTATFIERISGGVKVVLSRAATVMQPGDEALVVRLRYRLEDPAAKGQALGLADDEWEIGLLRRLR